MNKKLINWSGLTGIIALISYTAAVVFSPLAYPGYSSLSQAVSDLSAETDPHECCGRSYLLCTACAAWYVLPVLRYMCPEIRQTRSCFVSGSIFSPL